VLGAGSCGLYTCIGGFFYYLFGLFLASSLKDFRVKKVH
jgi:hypothetical protein